jgi:hypothetical protein
MALAIKEITDFSADVVLLDLLTKEKDGRRIESIVVVDAGGGDLAIEGYGGEVTALTGLQNNEVVNIVAPNKVLAAGTSVGKVRVSFGAR